MMRFSCGGVLLLAAVAMLPGCDSGPPPKSPSPAASAPSAPPPQPAVDPNAPFTSDQDIEVEGYKIRIPAGYAMSNDEKDGDAIIRGWARKGTDSGVGILVTIAPAGDFDATKLAAAGMAEAKKLHKTINYAEDELVSLNGMNGAVVFDCVVTTNNDRDERISYWLRDNDKGIRIWVNRRGSENEFPMPQLHDILRTFRRAADPVPPQVPEPEPVVNVQVVPLHGVAEKFVTDALKKAAGEAKPEVTAQPQNEGYQFTLKPLRAINKFSKQITFGKVTNVDLQQRMITVEADISKVPQDPEKVATDPKHPRYFAQNMTYLSGADAEKRRQAMERLLAPDVKLPDDLKGPFAKAMQTRAFATTEQPDVRVKAITAMVAVGGQFSVPLLCNLLKDKDQTVRQAAFQKLAESRDERALDPIARMFVEQPESREAAKKFLFDAGPGAEEALLKVAPTDKVENIKPVLEVLKEIGTKKSSKYLAQILAKRKMFPELQTEIQAVGKAINDRKK